ncbi:SCO family protein [Undibacterium curvum]|uniref:SCO family protein n=1 Tax=Undibacterium curvum TaxID=2762294 RepID=A0ABR7A7M4_9BURK|nr:SCO family protein [Undibacterium curvum]MBC3932844.1 SCO family protein [Undibacterium curvum]
MSGISQNKPNRSVWPRPVRLGLTLASVTALGLILKVTTLSPGLEGMFTKSRQDLQLPSASLDMGLQPPATSDPTLHAMEPFILTDSEGKEFHPDSLRGETVLLHFMYTACSSVCPGDTADLVQMHKQIPASYRKKLHIVSITVNPEFDQVPQMQTYAKAMQADKPGWTWVTGREEAVHQVLRRFRAFDASVKSPKPTDHIDQVVLMDVYGRVFQRYYASNIRSGRILQEMMVLDDLMRPLLQKNPA